MFISFVKATVLILALAVSVSAIKAEVTSMHNPYRNLSSCVSEDGTGTGSTFPCFWDASKSGNHEGLSFIIGSDGETTTYVK